MAIVDLTNRISAEREPRHTDLTTALTKWGGGKYQETGNASTNEAMLQINHAMGFEHELTEAEVVVEVDRVEEYLALRKG